MPIKCAPIVHVSLRIVVRICLPAIALMVTSVVVGKIRNSPISLAPFVFNAFRPHDKVLLLTQTDGFQGDSTMVNCNCCTPHGHKTKTILSATSRFCFLLVPMTYVRRRKRRASGAPSLRRCQLCPQKYARLFIWINYIYPCRTYFWEIKRVGE